MSYQITTTIIGLVLASSILYLVRRDHLHGPYALWWLSVAAMTIVLGVFPMAIDWLARLTGVSYPPNLLFAIAIGLMLLKMLKSDIESSRHERRIRRLGQRMAILSEENQRLREDLQAEQDANDARVNNR